MPSTIFTPIQSCARRWPFQYRDCLSQTRFPIERKGSNLPSSVESRFHDNNLTFRYKFQIIRGKQRSFYHLQGLWWMIFATTQWTRHHCARTQRFGEDFCQTTVGRKSVEQGDLYVTIISVPFFRSFFQLGKGLNDRNDLNRQKREAKNIISILSLIRCQTRHRRMYSGFWAYCRSPRRQ